MDVTQGPRPLPFLLALGLGFALLMSHGAARADAIPPPPACPPGSRGMSSHAGECCVPATCQSDADCKDLKGTTCRPWRVCTRVYLVPAGGRRSRDIPPRPQELAVGSCPVEEGCTGDEEPPPPTAGKPSGGGVPSCVDQDYCVAKALPPLPTSGPGKGRSENDSDEGDEGDEGKVPAAGCCKCHLGAPSESHGWLMALGLGLLALRRRRS